MIDHDKIETSSLGTIVSFDSSNQLAKVKLSLNEYNKNLVKSFNKLPQAVLIEVPVELPRCNGFAITFDIKPGDDCVVTFLKEGITHWLYENRREYVEIHELPEPCALRKFSKQDAFCRVSVDNLMNTLSNYSDGLQLRNRAGSQTVTLKANGDILIDTFADTNITVGGSVSIFSPKSIKLDSGGTIDITAADDVTVTGANFKAASSAGSLLIDTGGIATFAVNQLVIP